jgi:hypothetical protein
MEQKKMSLFDCRYLQWYKQGYKNRIFPTPKGLFNNKKCDYCGKNNHLHYVESYNSSWKIKRFICSRCLEEDRFNNLFQKWLKKTELDDKKYGKT